MDSTKPIPRAGVGPSETDYGAIVRQLTYLCQQVDALAAPLPPPAAQTSQPVQPNTPQDQTSRQAVQTGTGAGRNGGRVLSIPRLVLVGGQSTGKSSLVECLSGVSLPRSSGTCTRGPLDIVITSSENSSNPQPDDNSSWSAIVSLVLPPPKAGSTSSYGTSGGIVQFGDIITDPALVADRLRRATLAVRNLASLASVPQPFTKSSTSVPIMNNSRYQTMSVEEIEDAEDNINSPLPTFFPAGARLFLSIRAPGAEPLRFTDLPGLISEGSVAEVNAIRKMILLDISQDDVIIVLTASLAMDIRHQNAFSLVRNIDPDGNRTVGVLTMPDRMPHGAERQWSKIINESSTENAIVNASSSNRLKHGWHVVRCPAQNEDRSNIAVIEDRFFHPSASDTQEPWHKTTTMLDGVGEYGNESFVDTRCGLDSLYHHLSQLLLQQIRVALPNTIASVVKLSEELAVQYNSATASNNVGQHLTQCQNPRFQSQPPFNAARAFASSSNPNTGSLFGQGPQQGKGAKGFPTSRELVKVVDIIVEHLHFPGVDINNTLMPRLLHELHAIAPVHLPLTATEAREKGLLAAYKPRSWCFTRVMDTGSAAMPCQTSSSIIPGDGDKQDGLGSSDKSSTEAGAPIRQPLPKKKPVTLDELVNRLKNAKAPADTTTFLHTLKCEYESLQTRFCNLLLNYTEVARAHLRSLLHTAIPKDMQTKYAQLCTDILAIADEFVQSRVINEMHMLANRAADHSRADFGPGASGDSDLDETARGHSIGSSEYVRWVAGELRTFLVLRTSLIAKQQGELGDKSILADVNKIIDISHKHGFLSHSRKDVGLATNVAALNAQIAAGTSRASSAESDASSTETTSAAETGVKKRNRPQSKTAKAAVAAAAAAAATEDKSPSPEPGSQDNNAPGPFAPNRKQSSPYPPQLANPSSYGLHSTRRLNIHPQLALAASIILERDTTLQNALKLMAILRGDFNFFSLLVAREAQRIPVMLMKDLQSYLRTVAKTFGAELSEEELYKRYFFEADKPRREREEWVRELGNRIEGLERVAEELKEVDERLRVEAAVGGSEGWVRNKRVPNGAKEPEVQAGQEQQPESSNMANTMQTPQKNNNTSSPASTTDAIATEAAVANLKKVSPRTPRTTNNNTSFLPNPTPTPTHNPTQTPTVTSTPHPTPPITPSESLTTPLSKVHPKKRPAPTSEPNSGEAPQYRVRLSQDYITGTGLHHAGFRSDFVSPTPSAYQHPQQQQRMQWRENDGNSEMEEEGEKRKPAWLGFDPIVVSSDVDES